MCIGAWMGVEGWGAGEMLALVVLEPSAAPSMLDLTSAAAAR